jgi:hypothetical protein
VRAALFTVSNGFGRRRQAATAGSLKIESTSLEGQVLQSLLDEWSSANRHSRELIQRAAYGVAVHDFICSLCGFSPSSVPSTHPCLAHV